jgi:hypothetical protein
MNTRNIALAVISLVIVAVVFAIVELESRVDPPAKYIVKFGTYVQLADKPGFIDALRKSASWYRKISFSNQASSDPHGDFTGATISSSTVHYLTITQKPNPDNQHVTQRVGLNNPKDVEDLLSKIKE